VGWEEDPALFFERLLLAGGPVEVAVATIEGNIPIAHLLLIYLGRYSFIHSIGQ
jgi:hypothetical protein